MRIETTAVHAARTIDPATGAVAPPIHLSTTFERDADGGYARGYSYSRSGNPARHELECAMAQLEGGPCAIAFASGLAATSAILQSLSPGDHVIAPREIYHGVRRLLDQIYVPWGLQASYVHMHKPGAVETALTDATKLIWIETPANPMLQISDIAHITNVAHNAGALVACDNTFATPILQRPLKLDADFAIHATTKWIGGHSDVTGGVIVCKEDNDRAERLRAIQQLGGAVPSPFDCWLATRGVRTLACRVHTSCSSAMALAKHLEAHSMVESVLYPGLDSHEHHALATRQMSGFGGILSFCVKGNRDDVMRVAANVKLFTRATSLGGVESLIEHRESIEGPDTTTPPNLLRLSIGLEHSDDLFADLDQALNC